MFCEHGSYLRILLDVITHLLVVDYDIHTCPVCEQQVKQLWLAPDDAVQARSDTATTNSRLEVGTPGDQVSTDFKVIPEDGPVKSRLVLAVLVYISTAIKDVIDNISPSAIDR